MIWHNLELNNMRHTTGVLISSLFLLVSGLALSQSAKKFLKHNSKAPVLFYGDSSTHARALYADSNRLLIGNANGAIYVLDLQTHAYQLLFKLNGIEEIRDLERSTHGLVASSSGTDGKLVLISSSGTLKVLQPEFWKGVFIDAIDFKGGHGVLLGDPLNGIFTIYQSFDGGFSWQECQGKVQAIPEEAAFAASGANIHLLNDSTYVFISGGMQSRFVISRDTGKSWHATVLPYYPGKSTGPYALCFSTSGERAVMVGGDYKDVGLQMNTTFYSPDAGESWLVAETPPRGYRSSVIEVNGVFYSGGTNGIDLSIDGGKTWLAFADGNYFALVSNGKKLYASTVKGRIREFDLFNVETE